MLAGIAAFIFGFNYLKASPFFEKGKTFYAVYNNVGGLQTGTKVFINGFAVGNVNQIRFKDRSGQLVVTFSVSDAFEFSKNSVAELYDTGIIGGKGLQINPVFDGTPNAQSGDTLSSQIKPGLTELVQKNLAPLQIKVEGAVSNADSLFTSVNDVLDASTKKELRETIVALNSLTRTLKGSAKKVDALLDNNKEQLDHSLKHIANLTANFSKLSDSLARSGIAQTLTQVQTTVKQINTLLGDIQSGEGTLGKLAKDDALYDHLTEASRELDLLLQDFRLNPKRYVNVSVFGRKQKAYTLPEDDPAEQTLK